MAYTCICSSHDLFTRGCVCGAFKAQKHDEKIVADHEALEAKRRLASEGEWLTGPIPTAVTFTTACATDQCGHPPEKHTAKNHWTGRNEACTVPNCHCISLKKRV